jgi:hypothetical protein
MGQWQRFEEWDEANPHVLDLFVRFTFEALRTGRKRYSARDIIHRIRWHMNVELAAVDEFKINDHWSPYYARLFIDLYPMHAGIFEMREAEDDLVRRAALAAKMKTRLVHLYGR